MWNNKEFMIKKGKIKCKIKNLFKVGLYIKKLPHIHSIRSGIVDKTLVITVAPQKDFCPQGNIYPKNAIISKNKYKKIPVTQVWNKKI